MIENIKQIRNMLNRDELLAQLAEEASELAQAALKLRRAIDGTNPTPITMDAAESDLQEEAADVMLVLECLGIYVNGIRSGIIQKEKSERWVQRLNDRQCKSND